VDGGCECGVLECWWGDGVPVECITGLLNFSESGGGAGHVQEC